MRVRCTLVAILLTVVGTAIAQDHAKFVDDTIIGTGAATSPW